MKHESDHFRPRQDSPEPTIRPATPADAAAVSAVIVSLAPFYLLDTQRPEDAEAFFCTVTPEAFEATLEDSRYQYHVAVAGDGGGGAAEVVGVVGIRDGSHVYHLFIAEAYHRRGIASRLWDAARAAALAAGNPGRFSVNSSLYAVPLYRRFGFVATGEVVEKDGLAFLPMALDETANRAAGSDEPA